MRTGPSLIPIAGLRLDIVIKKDRLSQEIVTFA